MKQLLQHLGSGETTLTDIPCPSAAPGHLLIRSRASVVSLGTERMLIDFGKANLLDKARSQPDKIRQVVEKVRTDGLAATLTAVRAKMDQPIPLGYSNAGVVAAVGAGVTGYRVGDRVVSNGPHAEFVMAPEQLCAKIPDVVSDEEAAFTVLGAVALEGIRLAAPTLGETVVVTGLGLIGQLCVQLLRANGCRVLGIDIDAAKCAHAQRFGAVTVNLARGEDPLAIAEQFTGGQGMDAVIITASTRSNEPVHQAALMCRKRGRIVLVGVTGLTLSRDDFYKKELSFHVSCSYGPGRYDPRYEQRGLDYPIGFVRWTEQRNFTAVLDLLAAGKLTLAPLITHRFTFDQVHEAYTHLPDALGIVLRYPQPEGHTAPARTVTLSPPPAADPARPVVGFIGAGNFSGSTLLPALRQTGARLKTIASHNGVSGTVLGKKFGFEQSTSETTGIFRDPEINAVFIATRHDSHARLVREALLAGKRVFVEKPLCLTREELAEITRTYNSLPAALLMVGFNRRFSPFTVRLKTLLAAVREPKCLIMTVNAGAIPGEHWTQDPAVGGGRIIGEGCHFVDLLRFLVGAPISEVTAMPVIDHHEARIREDRMTITLRFAEGSVGTVHYFANGGKLFPKERLEVFCADRVLQLDNFRQLTGYGWPAFRRLRLPRQDKGHAAEVTAFLHAVNNGTPAPIPFAELAEVTETALRISEMI